MNKRRNGSRLLIAAEAIVLIVVLVMCGLRLTVLKDDSSSGSNAIVNEASTGGAEDTNNENAIGFAEPRETFSDEVEAKIAEMTLEEMAAQVFLVTPEALTGQDLVTVAGEGTRSAINTYPVGGFIYDDENFMLPEQTKLLLANAQQYSQERIGLDLFTAVVEVGGEDNSPVAAVGNMTTPSAQGDLADSSEAAEQATTIGSYLSEYGFNMNLGPIADVAAEANENTFGTDPDRVAEMARAQVDAYEEQGVCAVLRYFPGASAVETSEDALPVCTRSLEQMQVQDFIAYQAGIDAGVEAIMLGNVTCVSVTGSHSLPCSLSEGAVDILRDDMGFTGIIITAPLANEHVEDAFPDGRSAVQALKAGVDMICYPADFQVSYNAVIDAVNNGTLRQDRLEEAVGRILTVKMQ